MQKPPFNTARGLDIALQTPPPFDFEGVTMRVFPLRAKLATLQRFCDAYLNIVPPEVGTFRAFIPYVYLCVVNYGRMCADAQNLGWLAQREIAFSIPLEWYEAVDGRYVFKDWAYVSPFIYVDNELSMTTGREVYGWPKSLARLDPALSTWMNDPRSRPTVATVSARVFPQTYANRPQEHRVFLEIEHQPSPSILRVPMDVRGAMAPWNIAATAALHTAHLAGDAVSTLMGLGILRKQPGTSRANFKTRGKRLLNMLNPYGADVAINTINLKQFRSAQQPDRACYQALTNATMQIRTFNGGGLMGDLNILTGDVSGGFRVKLSRYPAVPIIESLGLHVTETLHAEGVEIAALDPVYPLWLDIDMRYNLGETLAWRAMDTGWHRGSDDSEIKARAVDEPSPRYNTTLGAASPEAAGPFEFPHTTLRVLPLVADRQRLQTFCEDYLNKTFKDRGFRFEPWGSHVYLVITSYKEMSSESNNVGRWAQREVMFHVPVRWYEHGKLRTVALVPVFAYADSAIAAITSSEVSGIPTLNAELESPPDAWMESDGMSTRADRPVLRVVTEVLPVVGEGQEVTQRVLLEISEGEPLPMTDAEAWRFVGSEWGRVLKGELARKRVASEDHHAEYRAARALTLEVLSNGRPINLVTLKQFRDATDPQTACYQSLIQLGRVIDRVYDLQEIETPLHVRIHDYPTQAIVESLGLVPKTTDASGTERVYTLEPVRPFWMRVDLREDLGRTVCRRDSANTWRDESSGRQPDAPGYFQGGEPLVGPGLERRVEAVEPRGLRDVARDWREIDPECAIRITREVAAQSVEVIDPQMVLDCLLSREWEHRGEPRWEKTRDRLRKELETDEVSTLASHLGSAQMKRLDEVLAEIEPLSRRKRLIGDIKDTLEHLRAAALLLDHVEVAAGLIDEAVQAEHEGANRDEAMLLERVRKHFPPGDGLIHLVDVLRGAGIDVGDPSAGPPPMETVYQAIQASPEKVRKAVEQCKTEYTVLRDAVVLKLSKATEKPDFCVRRDAVGPEASAIFPRSTAGTTTGTWARGFLCRPPCGHPWERLRRRWEWAGQRRLRLPRRLRPQAVRHRERSPVESLLEQQPS